MLKYIKESEYKYKVFYENGLRYREIVSNIAAVANIPIMIVINYIHEHNGIIDSYNHIIFQNENDAINYIEELTPIMIMNKLSEVK